jgi:site-specific DNA-methyltransferase (adenine-specific)
MNKLPTPFYQDEWVTVYHGDCRDFLPLLSQVDITFTDPPYGNSTHDGALTLRSPGTTGERGWERAETPVGKRSRDVARNLVDFSSIPFAELLPILAAAGSITRRWLIAFMERRYIEPLEVWSETDEAAPLRFVREGIYYKPNGAPQVSGDRPAQGWESIAIMHRRKNGRMRWNGGGHDAVYIENKPHAAKHPTQKPERLVAKMLTQFTDPGELVLDLFAGSGVTGVVCKQLRRRCILIERDIKHCRTAAEWLVGTQPMIEALVQPTMKQTMLEAA